MAVPHCFARNGLPSKIVGEDEITALYIAAVKQALQLDAAMPSNPAEFALNKASFGSALNTYYSTSRSIARDILHVVFFVTRGAPTDEYDDDAQQPRSASRAWRGRFWKLNECSQIQLCNE